MSLKHGGRVFKGAISLAFGVPLRVYMSSGPSPALYLVSDVPALREEVQRTLGYPAGSIGRTGRLTFSGRAAVEALRELGVELPAQWRGWSSTFRSAKQFSDDEIVEAALGCASRTEWHNRFPLLYREVANNRRYLKLACTAHMMAPTGGASYSVYVYEFPGNEAYVGLTCDPKRRHSTHKAKGPLVDRLAGCYAWRELYGGLSTAEAQVREAEQIEKYRLDGWKLLNKNEAGALGSSRSPQHSLSEIIQVSVGLTRKQFRSKHWRFYVHAQRHGWLELLSSVHNWPSRAKAA